MLSCGQKIRLDLQWRGAHAGELVTVSLAEILVCRTVFSVHLRSNTRVCDQQVSALVRVVPVLHRRGGQVVAISRDTVGAQSRYARTLQLPFLVLSDPQFTFSRALDAMVEKTLYGRKYLGPIRAAYVIDPGGILRAVITPVDAPHFDEQILARLEKLAD